MKFDGQPSTRSLRRYVIANEFAKWNENATKCWQNLARPWKKSGSLIKRHQHVVILLFCVAVCVFFVAFSSSSVVESRTFHRDWSRLWVLGMRCPFSVSFGRTTFLLLSSTFDHFPSGRQVWTLPENSVETRRNPIKHDWTLQQFLTTWQKLSKLALVHRYVSHFELEKSTTLERQFFHWFPMKR